jgi:hypothetical protein
MRAVELEERLHQSFLCIEKSKRLLQILGRCDGKADILTGGTPLSASPAAP